MLITKQLSNYFYLMRLHKPIGILLLLWPTLWALWLAANGQPSHKILFIFITGVVLMRSAGCILNDFADRHVDKFVERTKDRPITSGKVNPIEALLLACFLGFLALWLVLNCNKTTIQLAFIAAGLTLIYPYMKRFTHLPQLGLGIAFAWGVPMAFTAVTGRIDNAAWLLFLTAAIWPIIYDTIYAMVDREDDLYVGIKSTAILFAEYDRLVLAVLQLLFVILLLFVGFVFQLRSLFFASIFVVALCFCYQQWLMKDYDRKQCFKAFLNNNWVGAAIFVGIFASQLE